LEKERFESVEDILKTYNPVTGPIQKVVTYFGVGGEVPNHIGHAEYHDMDYVFRKITGISSANIGLKRTVFAGGKGLTLADMLIGSIAEAIERVLGTLAYFHHREEIIYGTYSGLVAQGIRCLAPEELPLFSEEQYKASSFIYKPYTADSFLGWIKGERLISGETVYVPAQLVLLFYSLHSTEVLIGYATSGGLTSHVSSYEAVYHGICELVERHAVNLRWQCGIPPALLNIDTRNLSSNELIRLLKTADTLPADVRFYYHSLDIKEISVVTAIEIDRSFRKYAYYPGGGADINIETALIKALNEYTQAERTLRLALLTPQRGLASAVSRMFDVGPDDPVDKINIFFKIVAFYGYEQNLEKMKWYLEEGEQIPLSTIPTLELKNSKDKYDYVLKVMRDHRVDPILFDFTPPYFRRIKLIKIFTPELTLPFLPAYPYLGHPKYYEIPQKLGLTDHRMSFEQLTTNPLPYP
jgi:ribosomal protein S12 methylthiotransferase accessory factor